MSSSFPSLGSLEKTQPGSGESYFLNDASFLVDLATLLPLDLVLWFSLVKQTGFALLVDNLCRAAQQQQIAHGKCHSLRDGL